MVTNLLRRRGFRVHGGAGAGAELGEFVVDTDEPNFVYFQFAEPALPFGLDDPVLAIAPDLLQA
jgi:hypothetical protein